MLFGKKNLRIIIAAIIVIFLGVVIVYPLAFNTADNPGVEEPKLADPIVE